jgi:hypothetical protein
VPSTGSPSAASRFTDGQTGYCGYYFRAVIDGELRLLAGAWRVAHQFERLPAEHRAHRTTCSTSERQRSRLWAETETFREEPGARDIETIDAELRLPVRAWRVARVLIEQMPSTELIDQLLDSVDTKTS